MGFVPENLVAIEGDEDWGPRIGVERYRKPIIDLADY